MKKAKLGDVVIFTPNGLDRDSRENGATKLAAIVSDELKDDSSKVHLRIFNHHIGNIPLRKYVPHVDEAADGEYPYYELKEDFEAAKETTDKAPTATGDDGTVSEVNDGNNEVDDNKNNQVKAPAIDRPTFDPNATVTEDQYNDAKDQFKELYGKYNAIPDDSKDTPEAVALSNQLDNLHLIINKYETQDKKPADEGADQANTLAKTTDQTDANPGLSLDNAPDSAKQNSTVTAPEVTVIDQAFLDAHPAAVAAGFKIGDSVTVDADGNITEVTPDSSSAAPGANTANEVNDSTKDLENGQANAPVQS